MDRLDVPDARESGRGEAPDCDGYRICERGFDRMPVSVKKRLAPIRRTADSQLTRGEARLARFRVLRMTWLESRVSLPRWPAGVGRMALTQ